MTGLFINPVTVIGVLLILFLPRNLLARLLAGVAVSCLYLWIFAAPDSGDGPGYALGLALLFVWTAIFLGALALRGAYELWRRWRRPPVFGGTSAMPLLDLPILAAAALGISGQTFIALGRAFQGTAHGPLIHVAVALAALVLLVGAQWVCPWFMRLFLGVCGLTLAALSLWGLFIFPALVRNSATQRADGAPYCIALNVRNQPVTASGDLTFFAMDKARYGRHAVLLVDAPAGPIAYHWSYRSRAFLQSPRDPVDPGNVACIPRADYLATLENREPGFEAVIGGRRMIVPASYAPTLSGTYLSLAAAPPDFGPDDTLAAVPLRTSVEFGNAGWVRGGFRDQLTEGRAGPAIHGLTTRYGEKGGVVHMAVEPGGGVAAWISCPFPEVPDGRCQHHFARGDDMYTFYHSAALLGDWRGMEDRLVALVASFRRPE